MSELLRLRQVSAGYGEAVVIAGIDLSLQAGESLAVLGRNGTGKTTLLNTIIGVTRHRGGTIALAGQDVTKFRPERRALAGIGWVPQERNIFKSLTVEENLTAVARPGPWDVNRVYAMFPRLKERRSNLGNQLSGGEQQMLAVGRALVLNPSLLLLDEPTEGLAPIIIEELLAALKRITRDEGLSALIVEQHAQKILQMTDRAVILDRGTIVHADASRALIDNPAALEQHLGVTAKKKPVRAASPVGGRAGDAAQAPSRPL
ncbi:ABC transporter ATP-binding protein [Microvirga subterranea]|uniref:Amino acid/amide ABC transporter ATP-binding protein 2 (HAAT family) n=1 Tax=Microvirga subterranea TaxID=186651 RepID=A0A370HMG1_9HYPH|nr:ABC transporter ATP-binding protein [Microvirga subterranea]RDI59540.1 amino acid/amide ABC transporter ATP-binding protein 2 (HAAT family) [Microvirga subterranea]